ncbi:hypothetical protein DL768_001175 [Monosporascus sp. mg162]|nr:hypothetical protein DL768_001175 [Monosporascus sp. mg162]
MPRFLIWGAKGWVAGHLEKIMGSRGEDVHKTTHYDDTHPIGGPGFKETEPANFKGSFYSEVKGYVEEMMKDYNNCLILRLRMPVSDDLHSRNFVTKISQYDRVVDIPNSNTILYDLLPASILLAKNYETGIYNFTHPGAISHNEVLSLFKEIVRPASPGRTSRSKSSPR